MPFTDAELGGWPISRSDLEQDYRAVAAAIGITGEDDDLRRYLRDDFCDLPRLHPIPPVDRLIQMVASTGSSTVFAGYSRIAVETRSDHQRRCTMLGECMTGCRNDSLISSSGFWQVSFSSQSAGVPLRLAPFFAKDSNVDP